MNVHGVLDSYRFITFLHLIPAFPHFSLLRFPKVDFMSGKKAKFGDNVSKMLLMGIKDHSNTIMMRAWL